MAEFERFENPDPMLNTVNVASNASGYQALSDVFGQEATNAMMGLRKVNAEQNQNNFYDAVTLLNNQKVAAQQQLLKSPKDAGQISQQFNDSTESLLKNANLNSQYGNRLKSLVSTEQGKFALSAASQDANELRLNQRLQLDNELPQTIQSINTNLYHDPMLAQTQIDAVHSKLADAVQNNVIPMSYYENTVKGLNVILDRKAQLLDQLKQGNVNVQDYHAAKSMQGEPANNEPYHPAAEFTFNTLSADTNFRDAIADAHQGQINIAAIGHMTGDEFQTYLNNMDGIASANGMINSATPYPAIQNRVQQLQSMPAATMSVSNKAELAQYQQFQKGLQSNYVQTITRLPAGQEALQAWRNNVDSLQPPLSRQAISDQQNKFYNQYIQNLVNIGHSMHVPAEYIKPVPATVAMKAQNALVVGGNPMDAINTLNAFKKQNGVWLASSMERPLDREVMLTSNYLRGTPDEAQAVDLIAANQKGRSFSEIDASDKTIRAELMSNSAIQNALTHVGQHPNGAARVNTLLKMLTNTVKYDALSHADNTVNNLDDYVDKLGQVMQSAYPITSGSDYSINTHDINLAPQDIETVTNYLTSKAQQQINPNNQDWIWQRLESDPISITNDADGSFLVKDANGDLLDKVQATQGLVALANQWHKKNLRKAKQIIANGTQPNTGQSLEEFEQGVIG